MPVQWTIPDFGPSPTPAFAYSIQAIIRVPAPAQQSSGSWKCDLAPLIEGRLGCSLPAWLGRVGRIEQFRVVTG